MMCCLYLCNKRIHFSMQEGEIALEKLFKSSVMSKDFNSSLKSENLDNNSMIEAASLGG